MRQLKLATARRLRPNGEYLLSPQTARHSGTAKTFNLVLKPPSGAIVPFSRSKRKFRLGSQLPREPAVLSLHAERQEASNRPFASNPPQSQQILETFREQPSRLYPCVPRRQGADSVETILCTCAIPRLRQAVGI